MHVLKFTKFLSYKPKGKLYQSSDTFKYLKEIVPKIKFVEKKFFYDFKT